MQATRTFRIFVSSTFGDMAAEREVLHRQVFPALRALCAEHGCRFQAIDLRWGVSQEAALDQRTMEICLREIARCQEVTPQPNFVVLLGDRYGWRPLPAEVPAGEFERLLHATETARRPRPRLRALLERWYRRDDNAEPTVFVLQPREIATPPSASDAEVRAARDAEFREWSRVEQRLRTALRAAAARAGFPPAHSLRRFPSATEQEIVHGALEGTGTHERVVCFFRRLEGEPPAGMRDDIARRFRDTDLAGNRDREADARQRLLKRALRRRLGRATVLDAAARWSPEGATTDHLGALAQAAREVLEGRIRDAIAQLEAEPPLVIERAIHDRHAAALTRDFVAAPRADESARIAAYVASLPGHLLAVTGASGSGKSALLAWAGHQAAAARPEAVIVRRFLGLSPRSADPRILLRDLCEEIGQAYGDRRTPPQEFRALAQEFNARLSLATAARPLLLLLDALDQLTETESAHHLAWLPAVLPPHTGAIVSTLPGDCQHALGRKRPAVEDVRLRDLTAGEDSDAAAILEASVRAAGRRLQPAQQARVLDAAARCPSPLFVRLAAAEAIRWRSYSAVPPLPDSVEGLIDRLLSTLALPANHGPLLVARSLGYLAAAKRGLTEDELLDVLSADPDVLGDFERRSPYGHALPEHRLPVVVWSRLSFDLQPYLAERHADGTNVLAFYHAQLRRLVHARYLGPSAAVLHRSLAAYFGPQPDFAGGDAINVRRVSELPFHQIRCADWPGLEATLGDLEFLDRKARAGLVFDTIDDFELLESTFASVEPLPAQAPLLREIARAYNQEFRTFLERPIAGQQLFNNLYAQDGEGGPAAAAVQRFGARRGAPAAWVRRRNAAPETATARHLVRTLAAHDGAVRAVAVSPSGRQIASGGADGVIRVWRARDGGLAASIKGEGAEIAGLAWMPGDESEMFLVAAHANGVLRLIDWRSEAEHRRWTAGHRVRGVTVDGRSSRVVTAGEDRTLRVFDPASGAAAGTLHGHQDRVLCVAAIPGRDEVLSGGEDRTLRGWSLATTASWILRGAEDSVRAVTVAPSGAWAVSGGDDRQPRLWHLEDGRQRGAGPIGTGHRAPIRCLAVVGAEEGSLRVAGGGEETVHIWDPSSGVERSILHGHNGPVEALSAAAGRDWFVSGGDDGTVRTWECPSGPVSGRSRIEHGDRVNAIALAGDVLVTASADRTLKAWSAADGRLQGTLRGHLDAVTAVAAIDGELIASASADRTIRIWELRRYDTLATFGTPLDLSSLAGADVPETLRGTPGHRQAVTALASLWDRRLASGSRDGSVRIWNVETRQSERELQAGRGVVERLLAAPSSRALIATGTGPEGALWHLDRASGAIPLAGHAGRIGCAAVADAAGLAATGGYDGAVRVWRLDSGACCATCAGHEGWVLCVDCDGTAATLVSGGQDGTIHLWDASSGRSAGILRAHAGPVRLVRLDTEGARLASWGVDGWLRIWDSASGREVAAVHLDAPVTALHWSPRGDLVMGTRWGGLGIFRVEPVGGSVRE